MNTFASLVSSYFRKLYNIKSPMNVWKRQFSDLTEFDYIAIRHRQFAKDFGREFLVGSTIKVRMPQRFTEKY